MQDSSVLITHEGIYGWAREYLPGYSDRVVNYGHASPILGVQMARSAGYSKILMIWWVNGSGWYGQRDVTSGFSPLTVDGKMAIYQYNKQPRRLDISHHTEAPTRGNAIATKNVSTSTS